MRHRIAALAHLPTAWLIVPGLLLYMALALFSMAGDSPTMDEQNHIARGVALWRTGDPRLSVEHPPFGNLLSGGLLLTLPDMRLPTDHPSWEQTDGWYAFADQFLWVYNHDVTRMIFLARLPMVFLLLALALVGFQFGRVLWGRRAGLLVFHLLLFDPNLLAHGRYATTDVAGTFGALLALALLWRLWRADSWSWGRLLAAALGLGLAFGSKLSNLAFVPLFFLLAALPPLVGQPWRRAGRALLQLVLAGAGSLLVLWALFGFQWAPLVDNDLPLLTLLAGRTVPLPTFWQGVARMLDLGTDSGRPSFLLGETSLTGFRSYFWVAFGVKTPLALLLSLPVALWVLLQQPIARRRALYLLLPALYFFGLMTTNSLNIGYRHLLPFVPLLYLLLAGLAAPSSGAAAGKRWRWVPAGVLLSLVLIDLWLFPHYLSYFNVAAGGPANGYNILVDSNVDWGQDLLRLQQWMADEEVARIKLGWFGTARPAYYGMDTEPLPGLPYHLDLYWNPPFDPAQPAPGLYAISASALWEVPLQEKGVYAYFRAREADARIGYSIFIYRLP